MSRSMLKSKRDGDAVSLVPLENLPSKHDDICPGAGAARPVRDGTPKTLTLTRPGLPKELRKSLASTNIMDSVNSVIARASRNVTR